MLRLRFHLGRDKDQGARIITTGSRICHNPKAHLVCRRLVELHQLVRRMIEVEEVERTRDLQFLAQTHRQMDLLRLLFTHLAWLILRLKLVHKSHHQVDQRHRSPRRRRTRHHSLQVVRRLVCIQVG